MNRHVRVTAQSIDSVASPYPLHIDLVLDAEGKVVGDETFLGVEGSLRFGTLKCAPFVLHEDGKLDYGDEYEGERYAQVGRPGIGLQGVSIKPEARFEVAYGDKRQPYKISQVVER